MIVQGEKMGYHFTPNNQESKDFYLGAFSWPILVEAFGYLFPELHKSGKYFYLRGVDDRYDDGTLGTNDNFPVTAEEAKIMARMARNYVAIQRSLPEQGKVDIFAPEPLQPWPRKIRDDFVDKFERFAEWAEKSDGFTIG
jgi:hypothetical protein